MASPPRLPPLSLPESLSNPQFEQDGEQIRVIPSSSGGDSSTPSPTSLNLALSSPEGINCYGREREALTEQSKFCNNEKLSDIVLVVGGRRYFAHKLILVRSSDVFERMLTGDWEDSGKKVLYCILFTPALFISSI